MLSVQSYNEAEQAALANTPNRVIEACRPEVFLHVGYPITVTTDHQLLHYVDVMHELRQTKDYSTLVRGLTESEFEEFRSVSEKVAEFTRQRFGRPMVPKSSLLRAFYTFRTIRDLVPNTNSIIFECGPGCGYLGLLLARAGYTYVANEIAQAFYLYQSQLWEYFFGDRLVELASGTQTLQDFQRPESGAIIHVPWWKFTQPRPEPIPFAIDLVTCNHMLCEMHRYAMNYLVRYVRAPLARSEKLGLFFAEGMGSELLQHRYDGYDVFKRLEYARGYADKTVDVWIPNEKVKAFISNQPDPIDELVESEPDLAVEDAPGGSEGDFLGAGGPKSSVTPWDERSSASKFSYLLGRAVTTLRQRGVGEVIRRSVNVLIPPAPSETGVPQPSATNPHPVLSPSNLVARAIKKGRQDRADLPRVPFAKLTEMQRALMDGQDPRTDDEFFFQYCFGEDYYS